MVFIFTQYHGNPNQLCILAQKEAKPKEKKSITPDLSILNSYKTHLGLYWTPADEEIILVSLHLIFQAIFLILNKNK